MRWYRTRTLCPCVVALLASHCAATPRGGGGPWPGSNVDTMSTPGSGATVNNVKRKVAMLQLDRSERSLQNLSSAIGSLVSTHGKPDVVMIPAGYATTSGLSHEQHAGPLEEEYCKLASTHNVALVGTYTTTSETNAVLCGANGDVVLTYSKQRGTLSNPTAGSPHTAVLPLADGGSVRVGMLLDTDYLFMEPARVLMVEGVQLVLHALEERLADGDARYLFWLQRDNSFEYVSTNFADVGGSMALPASPATGGACYYSESQGPRKTTLAELDPCLILPAGVTTSIYTTSPIAPTADDVGNQGSWGDPESSRKPFDYQSMCYPEENVRAALWGQQYKPKDGEHHTKKSPIRHHVKVALVQLAAATGTDPLAASYAAAEPRIREAAADGADVALLPEQWSVGYMGNMQNFSALYYEPDSTHVAYRGYMSWATPLDGPYVAKFRALARELNMAIALPFVQAVREEQGAPIPPRNSVSLIDRFGNIVYTYSKVHIATGGTNGGDVEGLNSAGRGWYSGQLDVAGLGNVTACSFICYDREHPESARGCRAAGAELVLVPTACGVDYAAVDLIAVRAGTNAMAIAMANFGAASGHKILPRTRGGAGSYYCGGLDCNGLSMGADHLGNVLFTAPGDPGTMPEPDPSHPAGAVGVFNVAFNITALREYREGPRGKALAEERLAPELCRIPTAPSHSAPTCNAHRMWL